MSKVYFLFGVHNHQPTGNFSHIFEQAYQRCYFPFISLLEKFPKVKFSLHNSGCLYDWIKEFKKEYMQILKKLVKRGQAEVVSGGYYEPILPLISDEDKIGQIHMMNEFIRKEFNSKPRGIWTTERVWEPYLARIINACGLKYTFLDDTHFRFAGLQEEEFFGYYTTEDEGKPLFIFPISKTLRYKIPFSEPQEAIDILNGFARKQDVLVTLFDDGEKFGLWPHTYEWVYEKEWLKKFLSLLGESRSIETITPHEAIEKFSSTGIVYLPTASYEEMGEWVLKPQVRSNYEALRNFLKENNRFKEFKDFIRGGFFRNFMSKYSRLNYMHKRMLSLSRKINRETTFKKDKKIFINLWKSQTNCGYWHGIFGGFYLGHIRAAIYEHLIKAENLLDKKISQKELVIEEEDIDLDDCKEIILKNKSVVCCFSQKGGALLECSLRGEAINLFNTITRQKESYHKEIRENVTTKNEIATIHDVVKQKEKDLDRFLIYDRYERLSLIDHLLEKDLTIDDFNHQQGVYTLSDKVYDLSKKRDKKEIILNYSCSSDDLNFFKKIRFSSSCGFCVEYVFNKSSLCAQGLDKKNTLNNYNFGIEFNLSLPSLEHIFKKDKGERISLNQARAYKDSRTLTIIDRYKKINLEFKFDSADIFSLPLYSVSSSESGFEKVYQQLTILFIVRNKRDRFGLSFNSHSGL
ncbi:MAG: DUF1926 domain-containing protein [Candidatus Omnitrophica bacterium]|nr:DUF1926 domain-containing protein [Candidatus Omnitrophota bacterium]